MQDYHTNEFTMGLPAELKDKTHHIFSLVHEGPSQFSLVVARAPVKPLETLADYEARLLPELRRMLSQFELVQRSDTRIDGVPALRLEYRWLNQGVALHQFQVVLIHEHLSGHRQLLQLTATLTGGPDVHWQATFEQMLASIRLRRVDIRPTGDNSNRPNAWDANR